VSETRAGLRGLLHSPASALVGTPCDFTKRATPATLKMATCSVNASCSTERRRVVDSETSVQFLYEMVTAEPPKPGIENLANLPTMRSVLKRWCALRDERDQLRKANEALREGLTKIAEHIDRPHCDHEIYDCMVLMRRTIAKLLAGDGEAERGD
jgi:hypothetical protein